MEAIRDTVLAIQYGQLFLASHEREDVLAQWDYSVSPADRTGISRAIRAVAKHKSVADELGST